MPTRPSPPPSSGAPVTDPKLGFGAWVVLPTYDEAENIGPVSEAILGALPGATLLVVDDNSPDGTGRLADELAESDPARPRPPPQGQAGSRAGVPRRVYNCARRRCGVVIQMDADFSHDPAVLPSLIAPIVDGQADLVIGSRYVAGGGTVDWGIVRRVIPRGGSIFARTLLRLEPHDLTGGFKAWRADTLARPRSKASTPAATCSRSRRRSAPAAPERGSARSRSSSTTGGSGRARCRAGSSWRRCSSSSASGGRSCAAARRRPAGAIGGTGAAGTAAGAVRRACRTDQRDARRARRATPPGTRSGTSDGRVPWRSARRLRRRTARRRVVRILPPVRPRGPNHALRAPGRRRPTAAAHAPAAFGDDRRPVPPAARRSGGVACRAGRCRWRRLPRGRRQHPAPGVGAAGRRDAPRPRSGSSPAPSSARPRPVSASDPGPPPA